MKRSDNLRWSQVKTGIFIVVALLLFAGGILMMGDKTKMFIEKGTLSVIMPDVAGLKIGAPVWLAGVDVGLVTDINFRNPQHSNEIDVTLQISKSALKKIGTDSRVVIKTRGLMGEKYVDITPSANYSDTPPEVIRGESIAKLDDVMQKAGASFDRLNSIIERVDRGEGSLGKLTRSDELYRKVVAVLQRTDATLADIQSADGTIGKLVHDPELYDKMVRLTDKGALVADDLRDLKKMLTSKDNTVGKLLTDKELYDRGVLLINRADAAVKAYEDVANRLQAREGTAGKLLNDTEAYDKLVTMLESVDALLKDIKANPKRYVKFSLF